MEYDDNNEHGNYGCCSECGTVHERCGACSAIVCPKCHDVQDCACDQDSQVASGGG